MPTPTIGTASKPEPEYVEAFQIHNPEFLEWAETDQPSESPPEPPPELLPILVNKRVPAMKALTLLETAEGSSAAALMPLFRLVLHPDSLEHLDAADLDAPQLTEAAALTMAVIYSGN